MCVSKTERERDGVCWCVRFACKYAYICESAPATVCEKGDMMKIKDKGSFRYDVYLG